MEMLQLGPAGGTGGKPFEGYSIPEGARVTGVHFYTDWVIDALGFDYVDANGVPGRMPPVGGLGGRYVHVELDEDEYLTGISGRYGWYVDAVRLHTNKRTTNLFGGESGIHDFEFMAPDGYEITGLFGRADWYIDALGVIARPIAVREELVEGLAIASEAEAEWAVEAAEEVLDEVAAEIAAEIEAELTAKRQILGRAKAKDPALTEAVGAAKFAQRADPAVLAAIDPEETTKTIMDLTEEMEAELQAEQEEALLAAAIESTNDAINESDPEEEAWLSVGDSEPVDAVVTVRRGIVADQAGLDELEEAVMAEAIAAFGMAEGHNGEPVEEGSVDITLYTQIVEDEAAGTAVATVMAVASESGGHEAVGTEPDEAAVMVVDRIQDDHDIQEMEEEAVDGAIDALVEETNTMADDLDITIYTAIGVDERTGESYAAVVAIAAEGTILPD
jgi:PAS domain-containing protein